MPTPLTEDLFKECIEQAVQKVFSTMVQKNAVPVHGASPVPSTEQWARPADLGATVAVGNVGFVGDISGLVFIYLSENLAHAIVQSMLGMSSQEAADAGREVASDVIGELTNMTVGTFKNRIHDLGYPCKLTIPTVVWGADIAIQPPRGATRRTYIFSVEGHSVIADLMFKED